ncbi:CDP-glycerol glycerophosphotransferase family protein [Priestia megaterium]|uniref:CDP-glycerol glycerophosphotransferase family protein n=1 Tax=Priestia megaterium TaxID=1404 RepID=UPI0027800AED|nr:CDP-glycerol glycerophosphotransferase family protein [Priestia megaterium]MDQ0803461.1 CDP-glycerol glycerophosphotransferase (TagB/SpsB family) [Priestia megaterium]
MKKSIILFENLNNSRHIYEELHNRELKKEQLIYLDSNPSLFYHSKYYRYKDKIRKIRKIGLLKFITYLITKKTIVVSGSPGFYQRFISKNIIFLNHGWGTKSTPGHNEITNKKAMGNYRNTLKSLKYIICLSDFDSTYYLNHKDLLGERKPTFVPLGSPRNDYLVRNQKDISLLKELEKVFNIDKKEKKVILFSPTHRDDNIRNEIYLESILKSFNDIDEKLGEQGKTILFRPHYYSKNIRHKLDKFNNIKYAGFDEYDDVRPLMLFSDYLITDYSSIFVDYLLINKPIIFYVPDLNEYSKYRGLVIDYSNNIHTPGPKIEDLSDLLKITEQDFCNYDLEKSKHFFHNYTDDKSTERISQFIENEFNKI